MCAEHTVTWPHVYNLIKGSCGFKCGSIPRQDGTFPSLVSMGLLQAKIYSIQFVMWPHKTRWLKDHVTLWMAVSHRNLKLLSVTLVLGVADFVNPSVSKR